MTNFLNRVANWKTLLGLFLLYMLFPSVLYKNAAIKINELAGKMIGPIDLTFGFNPGRTLQMVADYGDAGRAYYKLVELTLDIAYPVVYALFWAIVITLIYRKLLNGPVRYLNLIPFLAMTFDFLENMAIVSLLSHYPEQSVFMASLCELFKLLKWLFFALTLFLVFFGLIKLVFRR